MNQHFPLISVITVSYNAVETIENTILSIINQTYSNIEYIIVDGKSTDGTIDLIEKYTNRITYWISEPDKGIYDAMNKGLEIAKGDWALFMGSDDVFYGNTTIECVVSYLLLPDHIYYGNVILGKSQKIYPCRIKSAYQLCLTNFCHQAIFYPRNIYKTNRYNIDYKLWADYVYNMRLFAKEPKIFEYMGVVITIFNTEGRGSQAKDLLFEINRLSIIEKLWGKKMKYIMKFRYFLSECFHGF